MGTRRAEQLTRQYYTRHTDWADAVVADYNGVYLFKDAFEKSKEGWHYHIQYNESTDRNGGALVRHNLNTMRGGALGIRNGNVTSQQHMARKSRGGFMLPENVKKVIMGYEFAPHSWWKYGLYRFWFTLDTQKGNVRKWFKIGHEWSNAGSSAIDNRWMVDLACDDTEDFTYFEDAGVTAFDGSAIDDTQVIPWNEPPKQMFCTFAMVLDIENHRYDKMICNGRGYDLSHLETEEGMTLNNDYRNGLNQMVVVQNRATGTTLASGLDLDLAFTAFSYD